MARRQFNISGDWTNLPTTARVGGDIFWKVETPAALAVERMEAAGTHRDRVICGLLALREDPGCIEAHIFLAEHVIEDWECYAHLNKAVETGRALWEPVAACEAAADEDFSWWGVFATRPYMRAIAALADWQMERGDVESATELYQDLLAKNPHDNQGIRYKLAAMPEPVTPGM